MKDIKLSLGFLKGMRKDYRGFISKLIAENGRNFRVTTPFTNYHFFSDPAFIKHVLFNLNYVRPPNKIIDDVLVSSEMILKSDQDQWRNERFNLLNLLMSEKSITQHADLIIETTSTDLNKWEDYVINQKPIPIHFMLMSTALKNLSQLLFGNFTFETEHHSHTIREFFHLIVAYELSITKLSWLLPTATRRRTYKMVKELNKVSGEIVDHCLSENAPENNVIRHLAKKYIPTYPHVSEKDKIYLSSRAIVFLVGGFENIASNLSYVLINLSQYPLVQEKVYKEIKNTIGDRQLLSKDIDLLPYTRATLLESLRVRSGSFIPRFAMINDQIEDHVIKKHDHIILPIFYLHHSQQYWENPEGFNPDRFLKPLDDSYQFIYMPFSAGPRACIGKDFAMVQIMIILVSIIQRYRLDLIPNQLIDNFQYLDPDNSDEMIMTIQKAHDY
jgi:cytochrome P450